MMPVLRSINRWRNSEGWIWEGIPAFSNLEVNRCSNQIHLRERTPCSLEVIADCVNVETYPRIPELRRSLSDLLDVRRRIPEGRRVPSLDRCNTSQTTSLEREDKWMQHWILFPIVGWHQTNNWRGAAVQKDVENLFCSLSLSCSSSLIVFRIWICSVTVNWAVLLLSGSLVFM